MVIGIGAWLGTIMLLNVWGIIWPNQKKILGLKPATDEEKAKARKAAGMASRVNFVLSIPMLHVHGFGQPRAAVHQVGEPCPRYPADLADQVGAALREDIGSGDVTAALVPATQQVRGRVITREPAVLCGVAWVNETFRQLDPAVRLAWHVADGAGHHRRPGAVRDRRAGARGAHRRAHRA